MSRIFSTMFLSLFFSQSAYSQSWQLGVDLINSVGFEYHFDNKLLAGLEYAFGSEKTNTVNGYGTTAKLEYSPGIRLGWHAVEMEASKGFLLLSLAMVTGDGTINVNPSNPSSSTNGQSIAIKYNHRWYWQNFALGVGGGYRHNTITNVLVPHSSQTFDIKMEQSFGPVFGEVSLYAIF